MVKGLFLKAVLVLMTLGFVVLSEACNAGTTIQSVTSSTTQTVSSQPTTQPIWTPTLTLSPITLPGGIGPLPGGIKIVPSVQSPWPDVPVYEWAERVTQIKVDDKFCIGLDTNWGLGNSWTVNFDKSVLSLVANESAAYDQGGRLGTEWFLFKAIAEGPAVITFDVKQIANPPETNNSTTPIMRLPFLIMVAK